MKNSAITPSMLVLLVFCTVCCSSFLGGWLDSYINVVTKPSLDRQTKGQYLPVGLGKTQGINVLTALILRNIRWTPNRHNISQLELGVISLQWYRYFGSELKFIE